MIGLDRSQKQW